MIPLSAFGGTDVGREREGNEDSFRVAQRPDGAHLLIVCDGMGGHDGGEIASRVAADALLASLLESVLPPPEALKAALVAANNAVITEAKGSDMGTTAVVAWVQGSQCWYGWVGDSRFLHVRDGRVHTISQDHTRTAMLVSKGLIRPEDAVNHPEAHVLTQAMGGGHAAQRVFSPTIIEQPITLHEGDAVVLCSDGLHDMVDNPEVPRLIAGATAELATNRLIAAANSRGGLDNITVVTLIAGDRVPPVPVEDLLVQPEVQQVVERVVMRTPILPWLLLGAGLGFAIGGWVVR